MHISQLGTRICLFSVFPPWPVTLWSASPVSNYKPVKFLHASHSHTLTCHQHWSSIAVSKDKGIKNVTSPDTQITLSSESETSYSSSFGISKVTALPLTAILYSLLIILVLHYWANNKMGTVEIKIIYCLLIICDLIGRPAEQTGALTYTTMPAAALHKRGLGRLWKEAICQADWGEKTKQEWRGDFINITLYKEI